MPRLLSFAALAVALVVPPLPAQITLIDEGSFALYVNGQRVGTEQFRIHKRPQASGFEILATATITMGTRRIATSLSADTTGLPLVYTLEEREDDRITRRLHGAFAGRRFTVKTQNEVGPTERELPVAAGTMVLDEDVVHQYYFTARQRSSGPVPVVVPRRLTRDTIMIAARGEGPVDLGNGNVPSRRLSMTNAAGTVTDVWIDAAGRVLRVAVPARGFLAVRDEPPR